MFYQNILSDLSPYMARVTALDAFGEHRHADIELHYAVRGGFTATVNKRNYEIGEGELLLVSPMTSHAFPPCADRERKILTVVLGVSFLKKFFSYFSGAGKDAYTLMLDGGTDTEGRLTEVLKETALLCGEKSERNDLLIRGNLCKACAYLIDLLFASSENAGSERRELRRVANVERALEMIYYDYASPLTVEAAAEATGYGKSNFCKIFKSITGETFHQLLSRQRVECACRLLSETDLSVGEISAAVGFGETKSFCRVFRSLTAKTPKEYRRSAKKETLHGGAADE